MSQDRIAELLQQLETELDAASDVNGELRQRLQNVAQAVRNAIDRPAISDRAMSDRAGSEPLVNEPDDVPSHDDDDSLVGQLREAADQFEQSYPKLTHTVGRIADALGQLGI